MSREHVPERLRAVGASDLERRILDAAAHEQPSSEMRERMAQAIGIPLGAITGTAVGTAAGAGAAATKAAVGAGASTTGISVLWISLSVAALVVAGAVVGTRVWKKASATHAPPPAAALVPVVVKPVATAPTTVAPTAVVSTTAAEPPTVSVATPRPRRGTGNQGGTTATDLRDQIALVDAARTAVSAGAGDRALRILLQYDETYPNGSFRPETAALRIEALVKVGRGTEARALAQRFVAEYGRSPLAERVARLVGLPRR